MPGYYGPSRTSQGGSPGGAVSNVQYNNAGQFGGSDYLTYWPPSRLFFSMNRNFFLAETDNGFPTLEVSGYGDGVYYQQTIITVDAATTGLPVIYMSEDSSGSYGLLGIAGDSGLSNRLGEIDFVDRYLTGDQRVGSLFVDNLPPWTLITNLPFKAAGIFSTGGYFSSSLSQGTTGDFSVVDSSLVNRTLEVRDGLVTNYY